MKRVLKKLLICLVVIVLLNNFVVGNLFTNVSYAITTDDVLDAVETVLGTVVGLLTWPIRLVAITIGLAVNTLMGTVAYVEGGTVNDTNVDPGTTTITTLSPFDILFNNIALLRINFFDRGDNEDSILYKFRTSIAFWYYALRNIAVTILLCVLIYVGIRMALSTVSAEQKASYKKMLVDWVVSLAIVFVLQYIILFTVYANDAIVDAIQGMGDTVDIEKSLNEIAMDSITGISISSVAATVVYCMLVFQTFGLFISYFNRMLKLAFLIIISPLITLTYSIDKMGDGKAQALNTWLKEYVFTILIQPFHCIIYMTFVSTAVSLLGDASESKARVGNAIIAILCVNFIKEGEKIVRKIFAFADDNQHTSLAAGMAVASVAASKAKNVGKSTRKAVNGIKNFSANAGSALSSARVEAVALGRMLSGNDENKSFEDIKSEVRTEIDERKAEKEENKKYGVSADKHDDAKWAAHEEAVATRAQALMKEGMNPNEAKAKARLAIAQESRKAKKKDSFNKKHPKISAARGTLKKVKSVAQQSETLKQLGKMTGAYVAAGAGLALGSGVYGLTGSATQGVLSGYAMGRGVGEFMKNSSSTLKGDTDKRLTSLGVSGKSDAAIRINDILANADKYEGTDELDKIMKEIEKALEQVGVNGKVKTNIKNTIQKAVASNPSADVKSLVSNALAANGISGVQQNDNLFKKTEDLATFTQEKGIYDNIKQAGDIGIGPDAFVADIIKSYEGTGGVSSSAAKVSESEFIENAVGITAGQDGKEDRFVAPDDDSTREFLDGRNEADLEEFYKQCDREVSKTNRELDKVSDERLREELIARLNQIEAARAKVQDAELDREIERMRKEFQAAADRAAQATEKEAQRQVDRELARLQGDYDKYIKEAEDHLQRGQMEGTKSEAEITAQKMQLEQQLRQVETIRQNLKNPNNGGQP